MKKIKSVLKSKEAVASGNADSLVLDLKKLGLVSEASVIAKAISATKQSDVEADIDDSMDEVLEEESADTDDTEEDSEDDIEMEDELEHDEDSDEDSDAVPDEEALSLDFGATYSEASLRKLKNIAIACIEDNKSTKAAKALLRSIKEYEATR